MIKPIQPTIGDLVMAMVEKASPYTTIVVTPHTDLVLRASTRNGQICAVHFELVDKHEERQRDKPSH
jgi:hypothetical protein